MEDFIKKVVKIIKSIPYGKVTNYGAIATLAGESRNARQVGYILYGLTGKYDLAWQRVINRKGYISIRGGDVDMKKLQKSLLEQEGVEVSEDFMVDLEKYGWFGE